MKTIKPTIKPKKQETKAKPFWLSSYPGRRFAVVRVYGAGFRSWRAEEHELDEKGKLAQVVRTQDVESLSRGMEVCAEWRRERGLGQ